MSAEESLKAREKLLNQEFWIPQAGGHKTWLKALCSALLDSEGVRSEALLLSRPLCLVSTQKSAEELLPCLHIHSLNVVPCAESIHILDCVLEHFVAFVVHILSHAFHQPVLV